MTVHNDLQLQPPKRLHATTTRKQIIKHLVCNLSGSKKLDIISTMETKFVPSKHPLSFFSTRKKPIKYCKKRKEKPLHSVQHVTNAFLDDNESDSI